MTGSDTIAAIATAPGRGGVAVVRVSGPDAWLVAERVSGRRIREEDAGRFFFSRFSAAPCAATPEGGGRVADSGLVLVFKGPRSYTGEDVVEFHGHGGSVSPRRVLEACFAAGARLANRGEFTERAFLNGKLDLSAAEAVIDLIDARAGRAADDAQARLHGALMPVFGRLYGELVDMSARVEHLLDVSEDEIPEGMLDGIVEGIGSARRRIASLLSTAHEGKVLREGALVVLAGAPNAGKSSLMNALLGESRAIVSDCAGTTRDSIEEGMDIDGWPIRLVDTAGLRDTRDPIEAEGVRRAESLVGRADVVVALDCDVKGAIAVHAKCDLDGPDAVSGHGVGDAAIRVSSKTGEGLDALKRRIVERLEELAARPSDADADVTARQVALLERAHAALDMVDAAEPVLAANSLRRAAESVGQIIGKVYSDDLLESIFSRFCVGK